MQDILSSIIADKRIEVENCKAMLSVSEMEKLIKPRTARSMRESLSSSSSGIIAEFKRRSPSRGWIRRDALVQDIVPAYCRAGAAALSILTDTTYFGGSAEDIIAVRDSVRKPILRKEFIIDPWQIIQSRVIGADAVLLIAAALTKEQCRELARTAHSYGLEVLLEIHTLSETEYIGPDIDMLGVNNRNLGTFDTDTRNSTSLIEALPSDMLRISESGIHSAQTVKELRKQGFGGFLIGQALMQTPCPGQTLAALIKEIEAC